MTTKIKTFATRQSSPLRISYPMTLEYKATRPFPEELMSGIVLASLNEPRITLMAQLKNNQISGICGICG
jgi:hypothetical protein